MMMMMNASKNDDNNDDIWTQAQQAQLENALLLTKDLRGNDKWNQIATMVSGKTRKQCVNRYKFLRAALQQQQQQQRTDDSKDHTDEKMPETLPETMMDNDENRRGFRVRLESLTMTNIGVARVHTICVQFTCNRCSQAVEITSEPNQLRRALCEKCEYELGCMFRGALVHGSNAEIGCIEVDGGRLFDMLSMSVWMSCLECSVETLLNVRFGQTCTKVCRQCHSKLVFMCLRVRFVRCVLPSRVLIERASAVVNNSAARRRAKARKLLEGIVVGEPLPKNGACNHYKQSHRWLRFPCCNKAFACDVCHDKSEDHEAAWAQRMICGYCSREQAFSNVATCKCGKSFKHRTARHWEGGSGCRNKAAMSRKDRRKNQGMGKTVSRKQQQRQQQQSSSKRKRKAATAAAAAAAAPS